VLRWLELLETRFARAIVHCSPQPQCHGPARALGRSAAAARRSADPRLRDQEMGRWQGRTWVDIMRDEDRPGAHVLLASSATSKAPGGESLGDAVERVLHWWTEDACPVVLGKNRGASCCPDRC
jgi:broad specificity phosphatase PhoE